MWPFWKIDTLLSDVLRIRKLLEAIHWALIAKPRFGRIVVDDFERNGRMVSNVSLGLLTPTKTTKTQHLVVESGGLQGTWDLSADITEVKFSVETGALVHATLSYSDSKGNVSQTVETEFTADDTVPPDGPVGFGPTTVNDTDEPDPDYPPLGGIVEPPPPPPEE